MNLALHRGWLGAFEAGLIAFALGVVAWFVWRWLARGGRLEPGQAIGGACVTAVVAGAGIDSWNLFYLGVVKLESPVYARIALSKIHDADFLGTRVFLEWAGALCGVVAGWLLREPKPAPAPAE